MIGLVSPVMSPGYLVSRLAPLVLVATGCTEPGGVELLFELPEKPELSPLTGDRLAQISLITWDETGARTRDTRPLSEPGSGIDLGRLDVGSELTIGVELSSLGGRLIGFGRSTKTIVIDPDETIEVPISVRRPFAYVPGGGADPISALSTTLATFDSTLDGLVGQPGDDAPEYKGEIESSMTTTAVAPTTDGKQLVVVGESGGAGQLILVATSLHESISVAPIALAAAPVDVSVTAHGRFAIVAHDGAAGGVSIVDLEAVRAGSPDAVEFVPLGSVGAVSASGQGEDAGRAFALIDRAPRRIDLLDGVSERRSHRTARVGCDAPASSIAVLDLDNPAELGLRHTANGPIQDIATSSDGSGVIIADACGDTVGVMDAETGAVQPLVSLLDASSVAIQGKRVVAAGAVRSQTNTTIELVSVDIDGANESRVTLPQRQERGELIADNTQSIEIVIDADDVLPYEIAAAPDGQHVAILAEAYHHAEERPFGVPPEMEIDTYEYLLVDASTGSLIQRVRTYCLIRVLSSTAFEPECTVTPGQDAIPDRDRYVPFHLSLLYGAR